MTEPKASKASKASKAPKAVDVKPDDSAVDEIGTRMVVIAGAKGNVIHFAINGQPAALPCGVEVEVTHDMYHAIAAHIQ